MPRTKKKSKAPKISKRRRQARRALPASTRAEQVGWRAVERVLTAAETLIEVAAIERVDSNKELIDSFVETLS